MTGGAARTEQLCLAIAMHPPVPVHPFLLSSLTNPAADKVKHQQYQVRRQLCNLRHCCMYGPACVIQHRIAIQRPGHLARSPATAAAASFVLQVDIGTGGTLRCAFSETQDLLFLLLQREVRWACCGSCASAAALTVMAARLLAGSSGGDSGSAGKGSTNRRCCALIAASSWYPPIHFLLLLLVQLIVFDLEYGQPAASSPLPASRPPLDDLLGCYGHAGQLPPGRAFACDFSSGGCAGCHLATAAAMGFHKGAMTEYGPGLLLMVQLPASR